MESKDLVYITLGILIGIVISYVWLPKKVLIVGSDADLLQ